MAQVTSPVEAYHRRSPSPCAVNDDQVIITNSSNIVRAASQLQGGPSTTKVINAVAKANAKKYRHSPHNSIQEARDSLTSIVDQVK